MPAHPLHQAIGSVLDGVRQSSKRAQWRNIEASVRPLLPLGSVRQYHLFHGDVNDFTPGQPVAAQFAACVTAALVAT